jgi:hypothetical protein
MRHPKNHPPVASPIENNQLQIATIEKHQKIICRNELVAGDDALAAVIVSHSKCLTSALMGPNSGI